jgi:hypothetical protein
VRIVLAVIGCVLVAYMSVMVLAVLDLPTAVVCERGRTYVAATPRGVGGRFEESRVGPCVFFNPEPARTAGRGGAGD